MDQETNTTAGPAMKLCKLYLNLLTLLYLGNNKDRLTLFQQRVNIHFAWLRSTSSLFRQFLNIDSHFRQLTQSLSKITGRYHLATFHKEMFKVSKDIESFPEATPDQHLQAATEAYSQTCFELRISNQVYADYYSIVSRYTNQRQGVRSLKSAINTPRWHKATGTAYHSRPQPVKPSPIPTKNRFTVLDYMTPDQTLGLTSNKTMEPKQTAKPNQNSQKSAKQSQVPAPKNPVKKFQDKKRGSSPTLLPHSSPMKKARKQILADSAPAPSTSTASNDHNLEPASPLNDSTKELLQTTAADTNTSLDQTIEIDYEQPDSETTTSNTRLSSPADTTKPEDSLDSLTNSISTSPSTPTNQLHLEISFAKSQPVDWTIPSSTASIYIIGDQDVAGLQIKPTIDTQVLSYSRSSYLDLVNLFKNCSVRAHVKHILISITVAKHPHTPVKTMAKQICTLLKHSNKTFPKSIIWLSSSNIFSEFVQENDSKECDLISLLRRSKKQNPDQFSQLNFISTLPLATHSKLASKSSGNDLYKSIKVALGQHWLSQMLGQNLANASSPLNSDNQKLQVSNQNPKPDTSLFSATCYLSEYFDFKTYPNWYA